MKKILVLTDLSEASRASAGLGLVLTAQSGARLILLNAWMPSLLIEVSDAAAYPLETEWAEQHDPHQQLHNEALRLYQLQEKMKPAHPAVIETISYLGILEQAIEAHFSTLKPDLILIGRDPAKQNHLNRTWLTHLACPIVVVPVAYLQVGPVKTIGFATDLYPGDNLVLSQLKNLSDGLHTRLVICHISSPAFNMSAGEEMKIAAFMKTMAHNGIPSSMYEQGYSESIASEIEQFGDRKHADLLALVHRPHGWLCSLWHLSNEDRVLAFDRLPIILMPARS